MQGAYVTGPRAPEAAVRPRRSHVEFTDANVWAQFIAWQSVNERRIPFRSYWTRNDSKGIIMSKLTRRIATVGVSAAVALGALFATGGSASAATLPDRAHSWAAVGTVNAETHADGHSDRYYGRDGGNGYRYEDGRSNRYDDGSRYRYDGDRSYRQDDGRWYRYDGNGERRVDYRHTPWVSDQLAIFVDHDSSNYGHLDCGGY
jgi:hypothetical protein